MRTTRQMSITLPNDMADAVRERVETGGYASESEVIRDGIRSLLARDAAIERWLREDVAAAAQTLENDPGAARTINDVRARLAQLRGETA
jgi:antitoxin ParD1/3/4